MTRDIICYIACVYLHINAQPYIACVYCLSINCDILTVWLCICVLYTQVADVVWKGMDKNNDGKVTKAEFLQHFNTQAQRV